MELASGLGFDGLQIAAFAANELGAEFFIPLNELWKRGLPTCTKPVRRRIDTDLADWRVVDGQDYLDAFDFTNSRAADISHEFFEVTDGDWTYVVPALALMRGIFRPTKHLLPAMFRPQALDQQCRLVETEEGVRVEVDARWTKKLKYAADRYSDCRPLFNWLMAHPSAYKMAGSVHDRALDGRIGFRLPEAKMEMTFRGLAAGPTVLVTEVSVVAITPKDVPSIDLLDSRLTIFPFGRKVSQGVDATSGNRTILFEVPPHPAGGIELTDQEWARIEPIILSSTKRGRPPLHARRDMLSGVLLKLATGQSWSQVPYTTGNWLNAQNAFRKWAIAGTLDLILNELRESRAPK